MAGTYDFAGQAGARERDADAELCERGRTQNIVEGVVNMRCRGHRTVHNILASKRVEQTKKRLKLEQLKQNSAAETVKGAPHGPHCN